MVEAERIDIHEDDEAGVVFYNIVLNNGVKLFIEPDGIGYEDPMSLDIRVLTWESILSALGARGGGQLEVDA